ncbi:polysaccharide deacetylase family protein [candidate division TA06 bacterium]|nr:polysaccharide deacetylase family protein [candidate division TA06 bacterium]
MKRVPTLFYRFGFTSKKIEKALHTYVEIVQRFGCSPTFPITATTLKRHPKLIQNLQKRGVEFAIHGYVHTDYSQLSEREHREHLQKAVRIFNQCGILFQGFRAPYLRWNGETQKAIRQFPFLWTSHQVMVWDVIELKEFPPSCQKAYEKVLKLYNPQSASRHPVLPTSINGFIEIPVSIPDDEVLIDRLGIRDQDKIFEVWKKILDATHQRGELFVLQLHHERIPYCGKALEMLLHYGREMDPPIWLATLSEIALWWKKREKSLISDRWPEKAKSAFSVSGDIDSITLFDFFMRIFEV